MEELESLQLEASEVARRDVPVTAPASDLAAPILICGPVRRVETKSLEVEVSRFLVSQSIHERSAHGLACQAPKKRRVVTHPDSESVRSRVRSSTVKGYLVCTLARGLKE